MSLFEEKSGLVVSKTDWGSWAQTIDDVVIEINVPQGTKAKDVRCRITPKSLTVFVRDAEIIKVSLLQKGVLIIAVIGNIVPDNFGRRECVDHR